MDEAFKDLFNHQEVGIRTVAPYNPVVNDKQRARELRLVRASLTEGNERAMLYSIAYLVLVRVRGKKLAARVSSPPIPLTGDSMTISPREVMGFVAGGMLVELRIY